MRRCLWSLALVVVCLPSGASSIALGTTLHAGTARSALPSVADARTILNTTHRHREWVTVGVGATSIPAFVVYPERADRAPVVVISDRNEPGSERVRAIGDQLAAEGFISIVPDAVGGVGSARTYAMHLPAANGTAAWLDIEFAQSHAQVTADRMNAVGHFSLTAEEWPRLVDYLSRTTGNRFAAAPQQAGGSTPSRVIPGLGEKSPNLPASYYTASQTLAQSKLKKEWVDIPYGSIKLHTWVEYPDGTAKTGVVIVMVHAVGLDDWSRSITDQLAHDGFIAVATDIWSGTGPNGGNRDSFQFDDEAMRAGGQINADEIQRRYKAAREWALAQPRANGKSGSIGFCMGGGASFRFAGEVPELNAAVSFYGTPPMQNLVEKINAPVLAFYGENDARVTATEQPTTELMKRLGKSFESHIYPKVTHSFVYFQDLSVNREAVADAWPRVVAFYNKNLK